MDPVAEAHRQEVLEGMYEAVVNGNIEDFLAFMPAYQKFDATEHVVGMPRPYVADGFCMHCQTSWQIHGATFGEVDPLTEADCQELHLISGQCDSTETCRCFMSYSTSTPRCQLCGMPFASCRCGDPAPGPCIEPLVTIRWLR